MSEVTYECRVKKGEKVAEKGFFFKALPFTVTTNSYEARITFKKGQQGNVVYEVRVDGTIVAELAHPDYVPDSAPELATNDIKIPGDKDPIHILSAMVISNIAKGKTYPTFVQRDDQMAKQNYTIKQLKVL